MPLQAPAATSLGICLKVNSTLHKKNSWQGNLTCWNSCETVPSKKWTGLGWGPGPMHRSLKHGAVHLGPGKKPKQCLRSLANLRLSKNPSTIYIWYPPHVPPISVWFTLNLEVKTCFMSWCQMCRGGTTYIVWTLGDKSYFPHLKVKKV